MHFCCILGHTLKCVRYSPDCTVVPPVGYQVMLKIFTCAKCGDSSEWIYLVKDGQPEMCFPATELRESRI
jgi:hypothetical protein